VKPSAGPRLRGSWAAAFPRRNRPLLSELAEAVLQSAHFLTVPRGRLSSRPSAQRTDGGCGRLPSSGPRAPAGPTADGGRGRRRRAADLRRSPCLCRAAAREGAGSNGQRCSRAARELRPGAWFACCAPMQRSHASRPIQKSAREGRRQGFLPIGTTRLCRQPAEWNGPAHGGSGGGRVATGRDVKEGKVE
jgi:hypothetical protein